MSKIIEKLKEPSTFAGLAAVLMGFGQIFDVSEAPAIADSVNAAANDLAAGNWMSAGMVFLGGLAVILNEKKTDQEPSKQ